MKIPKECTKRVTQLYVGDNLASQLYGALPPQRDELWKEAASEFSDYAKQILGLRKAIKTAQVTRSQYPAQLFAVVSLTVPDSPIKNEDEKLIAAQFLTDLLFARISRRPGYMNYDLNVPEVAEEFFARFGAPNSLEGTVAKALEIIEGADTL